VLFPIGDGYVEPALLLVELPILIVSIRTPAWACSKCRSCQRIAAKGSSRRCKGFM
jgi:hypothetical protein